MGSQGGIGGKLTGSGGITGPQQALAQYGFGEQTIGNEQAFNQMPMSTGVTQAQTGAAAQQALTEGSQSNADAAALSSFLNQQFAGLSSGLGSLLGSPSGGGGSSSNPPPSDSTGSGVG